LLQGGQQNGDVVHPFHAMHVRRFGTHALLAMPLPLSGKPLRSKPNGRHLLTRKILPRLFLLRAAVVTLTEETVVCSPATALPSFRASSSAKPRRWATKAAHRVRTGARLMEMEVDMVLLPGMGLYRQRSHRGPGIWNSRSLLHNRTFCQADLLRSTYANGPLTLPGRSSSCSEAGHQRHRTRYAAASLSASLAVL